ALKHALWTGAAGAIGCAEAAAAERAFEPRAEAFAGACRELCKRIRNKLGAGDDRGTEAAVDELFACIAAHPGAGRTYAGSLLGGLLDGLWTLAAPTGQGAAAGSAGDLAEVLACERQADMKRRVLSAVRRISARLHEKRDHKDDYVVGRALRLIEERYGQTELSLAYLAAEVFVSPNHLGMLFKRQTGKTPLAYIQEYRLARAEELLRTTKRRVSAIAEEVGIPNTSYFGTLFKQAYGMTPGEYQETTQR
ncbi:helix-turn-helix transcriptional regulator, partial [Paenibacillus sp. MWE-103]